MPCSAAGQGCTEGTIPADRGLCVNTGGLQCWDACDLSKAPQEYFVPDGAGKAIQSYPLMVEQIRQGKYPVTCPDVTSQIFDPLHAPCQPYSRCTTKNIQREQGMCVAVNIDGKTGNLCLDMCDTSIPLDTFGTKPGQKDGTRALVQAVRDGHDSGPFPVACPGIQWWQLLWLPFCLICCIAAIAMFIMFQRKVKASQRAIDYPSPEPYRHEEEDHYAADGEYQPIQQQEPVAQRDHLEQAPPMTQEAVQPKPEPVQQAPAPAAVTYTAAPQTTSAYTAGGLSAGGLYGASPYTASMQMAAPMTTTYPTGTSIYQPSAGGVYSAAAPLTTSMQMGAPMPMSTAPPVSYSMQAP
mmetsp:Transcript_161379/g.297497  ORF Transcript_161379/g.297497 Transcript_161379/m.297497 type:complete len:353 (-) Transcript_161379:151-1209(-)